MKELQLAVDVMRKFGLLRAFGSFGLALIACASCSTNASEAKENTNGGASRTAPEKVLLVESKENMGCLVGQTIVREIELAKEPVALEPAKASEDTSQVRSVYAFLRPPKDLGFTGLFVLKVWVEPKGEPANERLKLERVTAEFGKGDWKVEVRASGKGKLRVEPMWARESNLATVWRTCPEAGLREPFQLQTLVTGPFEAELSKESFELGESVSEFNATLANAGTAEASRLDGCLKGLDLLNRKFGSAETPYLWFLERVTDAAMKEALAGSSGQGALAARLQLDSGKSFSTSRLEFTPSFKLRIAVLDNSGARSGAELSLAISDSAENPSER